MDTADPTPSSALPNVKNPPPQVAPDTCVICLESISERAVTVPCNHVNFDFICILSWLLEREARCPLCKTQITAVQYSFHSPTDFKTFHIPLKPAHGSSSTTHTTLPSRSRRRARSSSPEIDNALLRRKYVYRHNLYSCHVGTNRLSGYRNVTPASFSASSSLQSKARKWIRRELQVFEFLAIDSPPTTTSTPTNDNRSRSLVSNNTEALLEWIILVLKSCQIKGADGRAEDLVQEFLGRESARLFLHELGSWLGSPYQALEEWDGVAQYLVEVPYPLLERGKRRGGDSERREGG